MLTASFTNEQTYGLVVERSQSFYSGIFSIKVSNAAGPLPEKSGGPYDVGGESDIKVEPGEKMLEDIDVSKFYDLPPGDYSVAVTTNYDVSTWDLRKILGPFTGLDATAEIKVLP